MLISLSISYISGKMIKITKLSITQNQTKTSLIQECAQVTTTQACNEHQSVSQCAYNFSLTEFNMDGWWRDWLKSVV
jgi:hypothetical protein